jgi:hypothetical protein
MDSEEIVIQFLLTTYTRFGKGYPNARMCNIWY